MATHLLQPDAVVLPDTIAVGAQVEIAEGRIEAVGFDLGEPTQFPSGTLLPGFVDLQVNGAGGRGVDEATPDALDHIARCVAEHGAAAFLPTLITCPFPDLLAQVRAVADWIEERTGAHAADATHASATPLGMHVEGPFLVNAGAHDAAALVDPTPERIEELIAAGRGHIRLLTLAPSRAGAATAVTRLRDAGITVALGHDRGGSGAVETSIGACVADCVAAGATMVTHLFNAMGSTDHRNPGMAPHVMDQPALSCSMILDSVHVHEVLVRQAFRCIRVDRFVLVTDCVAAMGMPDGEYALAGSPVTLRDGAVRDADGTLAGSALTMSRAAANFLHMVTEAGAWTLSRVASTNPARLIGAADFGSIAIGRRARFTLLNPDTRDVQPLVLD